MLVTGDELKKSGFLKEADWENNIQNATYVLRIAKIFSPAIEGYEAGQTYTIKPGEIVWVVTKEIFDISEYNCIALVTLRSTLTKKGLLALDTGFVDPGYKGPIGSALVNISGQDIALHQEEKLFRVIFIKHMELDDGYRENGLQSYSSVDEYVRARLNEVVGSYASTFLNTGEIEKKIEEKLISKASSELAEEAKRRFLSWVWKPLLAMFLIASILFSFVLYFVYSNFSKEEVKNIVLEVIEQKSKEKNRLPSEKR